MQDTFESLKKEVEGFNGIKPENEWEGSMLSLIKRQNAFIGDLIAKNQEFKTAFYDMTWTFNVQNSKLYRSLEDADAIIFGENNA